MSMHNQSEARSFAEEAETGNIAVDGRSIAAMRSRTVLMCAAFSTNKGIHKLLLEGSAASSFKMPHYLNGGGSSQTQHMAVLLF